MNIHSLWSSIVAVITGLCCQGSFVFITFFTGIGFGFLINDLILFPLLFFSLAVLIYAVNYNRQHHKNKLPLYVVLSSAVFLFIGIFLQPVIWIGILGLFGGALWDYVLCRKL